ncbi:MAG TPA: arsenate reductase ArsC [Pseudonocardiaceae bacterium]|jgi:protein-tyrosine-phosphatase|nr:arsenate reductase ArsC [Pseudonocardiaceae bacterium]
MPNPPPNPRNQQTTEDRCRSLEDCRPVDADTLLDRAAEDLARTLGDVFSVPTIRDVIDDSYDLLAATARVHTHLPVLATRFAGERLRAIAKNQGVIVSGLPEVLFVCVHNAGRSQMAAALLDHHADGRVTVRSAGSAPADSINPAVVEAMAELGLDLSREFPKPFTDDAVQAADVVITMGCGDACPVYPGKRYLNWGLDDPAGKDVEHVRLIRDEIDRRVTALLAELVPATA